ncbi:MAG TPA: efflux transporter outer membrane subunit [Bradyrhizobium sp.]|nr:efflux transporter outer membrane subunit [Bradyrhizobium sp.]
MKDWIRLSPLAVAIALAGCAVGPDYQVPSALLPSQYLPQTADKASRSTTAESADLTQWWKVLHDRELNSLVARARDSNPDLEIALDRLQEARMLIAIATSDALPFGEGTAGGGIGTGTDETKGRVEGPLRAGNNAQGLRKIAETGGFDASWELDLFGKYRRLIEARTADAEALRDARDWLVVTVVADVVRAYLDLRAQQSVLTVLGQNITAARGSLDLAQGRFDRGLTNELDVSLAKREMATLQADRAPLAAQIDASRHAISVLLGLFPEDLAKELAKPGSMPLLPTKIPVGEPIDLLRRRPDIREAERRLAAANARIGVVTADLFPTITLSGAGGAQGGPRSSSAIPLTLIGSIGPSLYWPLLDFGALDAQIEIADLQTHEALVAYKKAILTAVRQVDDAVASYRAEQERLKSLDRALEAARQATRIATERYDRGLTDFLNVLDAERQEFDLEARQVSARQAAAGALVAVYKALGGGWSLDEPLPPIRAPLPAAIAAAKRLGEPGQVN